MRGPVYKDSLGRCDAPSMLYDTIRNPRAPYIPPPPIVSPDTIESTQQRMNREVLERFKGTGMRLPHDSFVAVVNIGKYLFLAIMLPPYLCLYGIPRWLIVMALPQMFLFVKSQAMHIGRFVQELAKSLTDLMKGLIEQMIGNSLKMMGQNAKHLWRHLAAGFNKIAGKIGTWGGQSLHRLYELAETIQQACLKPLKKMYTKSAGALRKAAAWGQAKSAQIALASRQSAIAVLHVINKSMIVPAGKFIQAPLAQMHAVSKNAVLRFGKTVTSLAKTVKKVYDPLINSIQAAIKQVVDYRRLAWQSFIQPPLTWAGQKVAAASSSFGKSCLSMAASVTAATRPLRDKIGAFIAPKIALVAQVLTYLPTAAIQAVYWMWQQIPPPLKTSLYKRFADARRRGRSFKSFARNFGTRFSYCARIIDTTVIQHGRLFWQWFLEFIAAAKKWLRQQLVDLPQNIRRGLISLWHYTKYLSKRLLLGTRLTIAWLWVLCKLGMELVRELSSEISGWSSFNSRKF